MQKRVRTVKRQVTLIMVSFGLIAATVIMVYGLYLTTSYQRRITVQSVEFNLQLVSSLIERDLRDLTSLAMWCGTGSIAGSSSVTDYLLSGDKMAGIRAHDRISEEMQNNRAGLYVRRLIVVNNAMDRIVQIDNYASSSWPVNIYNIGVIEELRERIASNWATMVADPFYLTPDTQILPLLCPVYHPTNRSQIGTVFLATNTALITDKFDGYALPDGSALYLNFAGSHHQIQGGALLASEFPYEVTGRDDSAAISPLTTVQTVKGPTGEALTMVTHAIRGDLSLSQVLSRQQYGLWGGTWFQLLLAFVSLIFMLALCVMYYLDYTISRPIARLRKQIETIAGGDFSVAPELESNNELGLVGKGVNHLSHSIVELMDTRLRNEQQKRDLEYRMLQSQINPHFLYNTLNSIKCMATLHSADGIAEMTTSLSRMLRTIAKDMRKVVALRDELDLLNDYLVIQKYRYGDNVDVTINARDPALLESPIPRFSLQPLVENAIFHGIEPKGEGTIRIDVVAEGTHTLVTITDDGVGMGSDLLRKVLEGDSSGTPGMLSGLGLRNVDERLRYTFGDEHGLTIRSEEGKYTSMILKLPQPEGESA